MRLLFSLVLVISIISSTLADEHKLDQKAVEDHEELDTVDRSQRQIGRRVNVYTSWPPPWPTNGDGWQVPNKKYLFRSSRPRPFPLDPWFNEPAKPNWWPSRYPVGTKPALTPEVEACKVLCPRGPIPEWY